MSGNAVIVWIFYFYIYLYIHTSKREKISYITRTDSQWTVGKETIWRFPHNGSSVGAGLNICTCKQAKGE